MATSPTLDPYQTLGVEADADAAAIKKAYRKLVLTCHPDKVTDESLREEKQEEFHRIQQAYETIGEADNREKYDAEVKLKKLKEERDRTLQPKATPTQARRMNVNIFTAHPPPEFRSSSSSAKSTPSKGSSHFKQYSTDYARSWEHNIPTRSKGYEEERKTRRSVSEEKLKRDRDDARRDQERERRKDEEEQRRRARVERELRDREREKREERERDRDREARARRAEKDRKEQERRQREELERIAKHERKVKDRERDLKRRQDEEEKARSKNKAYVEDYSEDDEISRRNRSKKSSKRDSPTRDKPSIKRSSQPDEATREAPTVAKYSFNKAYAEDYIRRPQIKTSKSTSSRADGPFSSPDYQNPFVSRRVSGEAKLPKGDGIRIDTGTSSRSHSAMPSASPIMENPPRLRKAFTTTHVPSADPLPPQRVPLGRSQTMEPEYYSRSSGADRHRSSRERSSFDDDSYYRPKLQKTYRVTHDTGSPRVSEPFYKDSYPPSPGSGFPKVKYAQAPERISTSKRYDEGQFVTSSYNLPSYTDYPTATFGQPYVATN